jgi:hypothetical protein
LIIISATPSEMGDDLIVVFKRRIIQLHKMLYDNFMDENDYIVVMVYDDHIIVFDTFTCLD